MGTRLSWVFLCPYWWASVARSVIRASSRLPGRSRLDRSQSQRLRTQPDVPQSLRVRLNPHDNSDHDVDNGTLITNPITGRLADWMVIFGEREDSDWNTAILFTVILPSVLRDDDFTPACVSGLGKSFRSADLAGDPTPLLDLVPSNERETIWTILTRTFGHGATVFQKVDRLFRIPTDTMQYYNPYSSETTYSFTAGLDEQVIVLVRGDFPASNEQDGLGNANRTGGNTPRYAYCHPSCLGGLLSPWHRLECRIEDCVSTYYRRRWRHLCRAGPPLSRTPFESSPLTTTPSRKWTGDERTIGLVDPRDQRACRGRNYLRGHRN